MRINCRLELMHAEQALENLEVSVSEEWPTDKELSSSTKADMSKTVNGGLFTGKKSHVSYL